MEGVTQGDPLAMVAYVVEFPPLIKCLKLVYHEVTQPFYYDNAGALGTFDNVDLYFNLLEHNVPAR